MQNIKVKFSYFDRKKVIEYGCTKGIDGHLLTILI